MKAENLIWVLIFLVYIVAVILKKARSGSKDGKAGAAKSRSGWRAKLDKYLSRIKQEMEASKKEGSDADTVWEELMQSEEDALEPARKETSPVARKSVTEKAPSQKIVPVIRKVSAESTIPAPYAKEAQPNYFSFGIQDLRKAVVWSEILAPPLALRDD